MNKFIEMLQKQKAEKMGKVVLKQEVETPEPKPKAKRKTKAKSDAN